MTKLRRRAARMTKLRRRAAGMTKLRWGRRRESRTAKTR